MLVQQLEASEQLIYLRAAGFNGYHVFSELATALDYLLVDLFRLTQGCPLARKAFLYISKLITKLLWVILLANQLRQLGLVLLNELINDLNFGRSGETLRPCLFQRLN